jgi:hypothetical protein
MLVRTNLESLEPGGTAPVDQPLANLQRSNLFLGTRQMWERESLGCSHMARRRRLAASRDEGDSRSGITIAQLRDAAWWLHDMATIHDHLMLVRNADGLRFDVWSDRAGWR